MYMLSSVTWALTSSILFLPTFVLKKVSCGGNDTFSCNPRLQNSVSMQEYFNLSAIDLELFDQVYFVATLFGSCFQSYLADIYGRKFIALPSFVLASIMGFLMTCFSNYAYIVILRFGQGLCLSAANGVIFVLASENSSLECHPMIALVCNLAWAFGLIIIVPVAYYFPSWKAAIIITHIPSFILPILLWFIIPESIHYLFERKKEKNIENWIKKAEVFSKKSIDINVKECIKNFHGEDGEFNKGDHGTQGILKVFSFFRLNKKYIIYVCITSFIWLNEFMLYYVFTKNATELIGNPYLNFALISLVEFPTSIFAPLMIKKFGRRLSMITSFFLVAILELILAAIPSHLEKVYLIMFIITKAILALNYIFMFIYFSEIFPTEIRNSSLGIMINAGSVGGIFAGFVNNSWNANKIIYFLSFSTVSLINIGLMYFLPKY
uniref:MFS domain-containing protein n=1 Tax=Parastrongyloides trichosuri TaxID=131310 RepID=A0A0N4Z046_PARTI